ncbi:alpha/beta hydrolase [Sphingosinithalassobacter sp. CS137]|uniref:alpha/beta hydrolase n=1 Tax=Sphingosinithalassobacter sp. CS137 TaxID=2762748 RepID=UPI00165DB40A|nr:alpha/beta hydrolase [Sphingosinithalassobacter sp. CS137]
MTHGPPATRLLLAEPVRALGTLAKLARRWPELQAAPRGDGRPLLLLPGLFNGDGAMFVMRRYLSALGYRAVGWELGRNFGPRAIGPQGERLLARVETVAREAGAPVTLIGVSLGGIMARIAAHRQPGLVREVVTVSAPFAGSPTATNVWRVYQWLSGERIDDPVVAALLAEAAAPLPVPASAIWSRSDGLVNGRACHTPNCRAIEVESGHLWVQMHPQVLRAIAEVLGGAPG